MDTHKLRELLDRRDALDVEILGVVNTAINGETKKRAAQKCSLCGSIEHTARSCPTRQEQAQ